MDVEEEPFLVYQQSIKNSENITYTRIGSHEINNSAANDTLENYEGGCIDDNTSIILDINSQESAKSKGSLNDSIITINSED